MNFQISILLIYLLIFVSSAATDIGDDLLNEEAHSEVRDLNFCEDRCGVYSSEGRCDCSGLCLLYRTCCNDMEKMCPQTVEFALKRYQHVLDASVRCGPRTARYEISDCLGLSPEYRSPLNRISDGNNGTRMLLSSPFDQFPIYDTDLDLLFSNISVYGCFKGDMASAQLWQLVIKISIEDNLESIEDMTALLKTNDYYFRSLDQRKDGVECHDVSIPRDYMFSITVDMRESSVEINSFPRANGFDFETMVCDRDEGSTCTHIECGPFTSLVGDKCHQNGQFVIRSRQPPEPFTSEDLTNVARYFECVGVGHVGVLQMNVSEIKQFSVFPIRLYSVGPKEELEKMNYFELTFETRHNGFKWGLRDVLKKALAGLYQRLELVYGHPYLRFDTETRNPSGNLIEWKEDFTLQSSSTNDDVRDTPLISPSPIFTTELSRTEERRGNFLTTTSSLTQTPDMDMPPPCFSNDPCNEQFDFVISCINVYVTERKPEEPAHCQQGLDNLAETLIEPFEECMPIIDSIVVNKSPTLFNLSITWACFFIGSTIIM